ncbi:hypothetical protein [Bryobacter aggregatus]|uniref:hypothetical protein n=1 Tax=Bryobacter aggregatus TaxID=360054 RepID=UPI0012BAB2FE|nr:hypothetical protein [Bryobacter aggregatus]
MLRIYLLLVSFQLGATVLQLPSFPQVRVQQFPQANVVPATKADFLASDSSVWKIAVRGVTRNGRLFHSKRFLPCDQVHQISEPQPGRIRVHTSCGDSEIWFENQTLEAKARHYQGIAGRHDRYGFIADSPKGKPTSSDNDGLWTAMYAAANLFEYRSTGSNEALRRAERAIRAILFLEKITGVPGYPARTYVRTEDPKPKDGVWYPSADGKYQWKSDTSSDEIVGHFLIFSIGWDLLPPGPLRSELQATCRRMIDFILKNHYYLIDRNGKPTRWGKWSPDYFNGEGRSDSPLNAIELLSFLTTAGHVTGDARYDRELKKVAEDLGYLKIAGELKTRSVEINYSDEELAMLSFYPLLLHGKNPTYNTAIRRALDDWFENIRREKNPLWNTIYEIVRGENKTLRQESIATLQRLPLDLTTWTVENSWRKDLPLEAKLDRFDKKQTTQWIPPDERQVIKWNGNPFVLDGGDGGQSEDDGTIFLLPYWMGRYHKLWEER